MGGSMTLKHIEDAIRIASKQIAFESYLLGMKHTKDNVLNNAELPEGDDLFDMLDVIIDNQLKGKNE